MFSSLLIHDFPPVPSNQDLIFKRRHMSFHPWRIKPNNKRAQGWNQIQTWHLLLGLGYSGLERKRLATLPWEGLLTAWLPWANIKRSHMLEPQLKCRRKSREKEAKMPERNLWHIGARGVPATLRCHSALLQYEWVTEVLPALKYEWCFSQGTFTNSS